MKKWLNNLSTAADNLVHALITPRHVQADELAAREFCQKMRGMGEDPAAALQAAALMAACGVTLEEAQVFAKMSAKRAIGAEDLHQLAFNHGYVMPYRLKRMEH